MIGRLCFITDPDAPLPVADQVLAAARGGARLIQLRDKQADDATLTDQAIALKQALAAHGARLIVNDRAGVALAAGAHGLHIGQGDGDPAAIRARIGSGMILGLSVETGDQLAAIPPGVVDYLGVGPVRATATKPDHAAPIGFDGLARIAARACLPCLAIGGLGPADVARVRSAGAAGLAVVSAISRAPDPEKATAGLIRAWGPA